MNPFQIVNDICYDKKDIISPTNENDYKAFLVNRALSYHLDCVLHANICNQYSNELTPTMQYNYLTNAIRKKKRFAKWAKTEKDDDIELVMNHFRVGRRTAKQYFSLLSSDQIKEIKTYNNKKNGGLNE